VRFVSERPTARELSAVVDLGDFDLDLLADRENVDGADVHGAIVLDGDFGSGVVLDLVDRLALRADELADNHRASVVGELGGEYDLRASQRLVVSPESGDLPVLLVDLVTERGEFLRITE